MFTAHQALYAKRHSRILAIRSRAVVFLVSTPADAVVNGAAMPIAIVPRYRKNTFLACADGEWDH